MRDLVILFVHVVATLVRLLGPGGIRSVVAVRVLFRLRLNSLWDTVNPLQTEALEGVSPTSRGGKIRNVMRLLIISLLFVSLASASESGRWISLFDGKTLDGWRAEGNAEWSVQDGTLLGRQGPGNAAGDLYTRGEWADFELECEFKVVWPANSGIWFRRNAEQPGYQADILDQKDQPNTYSGSLYAMNTGFIAKNSNPETVKKDGWNKLRMSAVGQEILITLNGKTAVKIRDNRFPKPGSIGIQVHPGKAFGPMQIRVRKIRLRSVSSSATQ